jgi:competence protein ComEC
VIAGLFSGAQFRRALLRLLVSGLVLLSVACERQKPLVEWVMVAVSQETNRTADAHLLTFADGRVALIDAGTHEQAKASLIPLLEKRGVRFVDLLVITHAHANHYGGIHALLDSKIKIRSATVGMPREKACRDEGHCNWDDFSKALERLRASGTTVENARAGRELLASPARLTVLYAFDGLDTPVGRTDINDTSAITRLHAGRWSVLFAGDLNVKLGGYLAKAGGDLKADFMTVPHHGTESAAPDSFFDRVSPQAAFVSGPGDLWRSERSARIRKYFESRGIPVYVSGEHGNVSVRLYPDRYEISKQRG